MKFRLLMEEYKFKSDILKKAVEKANTNGAGIENDGERYIVASFDSYSNYPKHITTAISTAMDKNIANNLVKQYKSNNRSNLIIVQKGNYIVSYRRHESGKWEMRK
jgi:hypothetical protein